MPRPNSPGSTTRAVLRATDRKSTRLNSSHTVISYAVFCLKKKNNYSSHFSAPVFAPQQGATVWLVRLHAIVMGNHIKATTHSLPQVNVIRMPGPIITDVTA